MRYVHTNVHMRGLVVRSETALLHASSAMYVCLYVCALHEFDIDLSG